MTTVVEIDTRDITVTPVFMHMQIENVPKSESAGHAVLEMHEVVQVRFAGSKNYSPIFPADAFWKRDGMDVITYAERWPDQYRQFKEGNPQEANGTPLEMLRTYGITPEQLSLCRALKIYSIEALDAMEGPAVKSLGMNANILRETARRFLADRDKGRDNSAEIDELKAQIATLMAERSTVLPAVEPTPVEIDQAVQAADDAYAGLTDDELKERIALKVGARPRGTPSRDTLVRLLTEAEAA